MRTKFVVLSVEDRDVVRSVSLFSGGLDTEETTFLMGMVEDSYGTELEAMKRAEELVGAGHMIEIKKIFI